ncbi:MAG: glutamine amidotransferase [bacterium]
MSEISVEFLRPWWLLLLLLAPGLILAARTVRVLGRGRKGIVLFLRIVGFLLLVGAVAETQLLRRGDLLSVMFLVDRSSSIPSAEQHIAETYLARQNELMTRKDRAGVIFFGKQAAIETTPIEKLDLEQFHTVVDAEGTDMARAVRLALAAFPQDSQKRIVLISDGNQTQGDVEAEVRRAKANDVEVSVFPLQYRSDNETALENIIVPSQIRRNEPFSLTVVMSAQTSGPGVLRLFRRGELVLEQPVELKPGKNTFLIPQILDLPGFYAYEAVVEPESDTRATNNRAETFVTIEGMGKVLYMEGQLEEGMPLSAALEAEGIPVEMRRPLDAPFSLEEYNAYDLIILSDVNAGDLSMVQQRTIQSAVRDFGVGLLMIGGEDSFGSGGYLGTPIEDALPVTMEIKQRKVIPSGALVMIMHTCEMPEGNTYAREISLAVLDTLSRHDYMGFLRYSGRDGESWLFPQPPPLKKLGDKNTERGLLLDMELQDIGDMPDFDTTLRMAYQELIRCPANIKHIIVMSDGDAARPDVNLIRKIRDAKITISTVCFDAHNMPANVDLMKKIAYEGGGNAYLVKDGSQLPSIFIKEAAQVTRSLILEEPFTPVITHPSEVIDGFSEGFPQLLGYVITTIRPESQSVLESHQEDPVLALRRYGVGKSAAFTSDAKRRWAKDWIAWDQYAKFWAQVARWTMRDPGQQFFQVESRVDGQWASVAIDAIDEEGRFLNAVEMTALAMDPQLEKIDFEIRQTAPGRYEGRFPVERAGTYMVSVQAKSGDYEATIRTGVSVPFSTEQRAVKSNESLLHRIAQVGDGQQLDMESSVFSHDLSSYTQRVALWPYLLSVALILFCLDICARRLFFEVTQFQRAARRVAHWMRIPFRKAAVATGPATPEMSQLMEAKTRAEAFHGAPGSAAKEDLLTALDEAETAEASQPPLSQEPEKPVPVEIRKPEPAIEKGPASGYTGSLLEAKRRAQAKLRKDKQEKQGANDHE